MLFQQTLHIFPGKQVVEPVSSSSLFEVLHINPGHLIISTDKSTLFYLLTGLFIAIAVCAFILIQKLRSKNKALEQELTIRKENEELFKKAEEEKSLILNSINETILYIDNDHNILWANNLKQLHIDSDGRSIIGSKCHKVFFNSDKICKFCTYPNKDTIYTEHYIPDKNIYLAWNIMTVYDDQGNPNGFVKTIEDITEKKHFEMALQEAKNKAEESDRLKSAFLANMSHEIRTPMNAIIGFSELLNDPEITSEEKQDYINIIQSNGNQLLKLISDILVFSQIESGQLVVQKKEIRLIKLLKVLHQQFVEEKKRLNKDNIEIFFNSNDLKEDFIVNTDPIRLKQILNNLMTNALKFTSKGSITLGVEQSNQWLKIYVTDTGCGIHPDKLKKIFKRFTQADDGSSRRFEGAGLGLAISKELISLLNGSINVESEMDKGSKFWITIPKNHNGNKKNTNKKLKGQSKIVKGCTTKPT